MDFAEREQQKKRRLIRVILGEVAMVLAVIFIVTITLLITMGFFVTSDGRIEQTGLIQIHSIPTGASVTIDGTTIFSRTNLSRSLAAGEHHLKLSRDNYDTWEKTIKMYSGLLMRLYYPRLFLLNRTPETMLNLDDNLEFYSASSERNFLLYADQDSPLWQLVNVASDDLKTTTLDLATILPGVEQGAFRGTVAELTWSAGGDTVLDELIQRITVLEDCFLVELVELPVRFRVHAEGIGTGRNYHIEVTENLLRELGAEHTPVITVMNKCDLIPSIYDVVTMGKTVCISAKTGEGVENLLTEMEKALSRKRMRATLLIPFDKGGILAEIRQNGQVLSEEYRPEGTRAEVVAEANDLEKYKPYFV